MFVVACCQEVRAYVPYRAAAGVRRRRGWLLTRCECAGFCKCAMHVCCCCQGASILAPLLVGAVSHNSLPSGAGAGAIRLECGLRRPGLLAQER